MAGIALDVNVLVMAKLLVELLVVVAVVLVKLKIVMEQVNVGQSHGLAMDSQIVKINSMVLT